MNQSRIRWASAIATLVMFSAGALRLQAQSVEDRINGLLSQMTLDEKLGLVHGDSQFATAGIPRLGIPRLWMSDGPEGVREEIEPNGWRPAGRTDDFSTWMPANLGLAATFDPDLAKEYGAVIGQEAKARGKHIMLGPSLNIQRTPLNGRNFEYLGEDPWLTSRMAVGFIHGEQGQGIASCAKHFAANNQETERGTIDVEMDERTLREIYLPAFRASVQEGGVLCVMGAYNKFRGQHCCENDYLLNKILKDEWGFKGMVISDWGGAHDTKEAALNGLDLEMGTRGPYEDDYLANPFRDAIEQGKIPISVLDDKVRRHLRVMAAIGLLDGDDWSAGGKLDTPRHQATARDIEEEAMVLLKNSGNLLPLNSAKINSIAVIGENAERRFAHAGGSAEIKSLYEVPGLQGIVQRAGPNVTVSFSMGYSRQQNDGRMIASAVAAAKAADVAIVFAGLPHDWNFDSEGSDRHDLKLPFGQDELIRQVAEANPKTIVVLIDGGAVEMPWLDSVGAVVEAWYPGMEGGNAIADVLFGDVNPSGKLPCTFPKQLSDSPAHAMGTYPGKNGVEHFNEGLFVGYRWFDAKNIEPLFPFGFGLSYTHFDYSNLELFPQDGSDGNEVWMKCTVANTGSCEGTEVVQLYVSQAHPSLPRPPKELKGFARIKLEAGQKGDVWIPLTHSAFAFYDPARAGWVAEKDDFTIQVGSSSRDIRLTKTWSRPETTVETTPATTPKTTPGTTVAK
ncbi:MAG TPA: glycoside hydrolase family 3 C-terminal domain-containing protein [Tepidisphaeraceae bacterium]|jgi:beta-glucosidase